MQLLQPQLVGEYVIGRVWCPPCKILRRLVVASKGAVMHCDQCGSAMLPATGDEV